MGAPSLTESGDDLIPFSLGHDVHIRIPMTPAERRLLEDGDPDTERELRDRARARLREFLQPRHTAEY